MIPRELLWGRTRRRERTSEDNDVEARERTESNIEHHLSLTDMLHSQAYADALNKAVNRKRRFDDKVRPVIFKTGDQVQVYDSKLDMTFDTKAKLQPRWLPPRRITQRHLNSYTLSTLNSRELLGTVHAQRLHHYTPQGDETTGEQDPEGGE